MKDITEIYNVKEISIDRKDTIEMYTLFVYTKNDNDPYFGLYNSTRLEDIHDYINNTNGTGEEYEYRIFKMELPS